MTAVLGGRFAGAAALLAAAVAGLAWASVFTLPPLVAPVLAALLPALLADWFGLRTPRLATLRPVLALLGGAALGLGVLTLTGPATLPDVLDGVLHGYRHTLDSTLPARPDPTLLPFVPALALLAGVVSVEWCRRGAAPVLALVPSLAVLVFGQAVHTAQAWAAPATAAAYGLAAAAVFAAGHSAARGRLRLGVSALPLLLSLVVVAGLAAWVGVVATDATGRAAYSVQAGHAVETRMAATADPLEEIGDRLAHPADVAFTVHSSVAVDRWPLVVLDRFDGANWRSDADYRILGSALPDQPLAVPVDAAAADVSGVALDGPWLPTQGHLRTVEGARTWVDPATGVLLRESDAAVSSYHLTWEDVQVDRQHLTAAAIDPAPAGAVELAQIPTGFADLARQAVGQGVGPSVSAALLLEKWMRTNLRVASGAEMPTGQAKPRCCTSSPASKAAPASSSPPPTCARPRRGIPTRVVVGFRDPATGTSTTATCWLARGRGDGRRLGAAGPDPPAGRARRARTTPGTRPPSNRPGTAADAEQLPPAAAAVAAPPRHLRPRRFGLAGAGRCLPSS